MMMMELHSKYIASKVKGTGFRFFFFKRGWCARCRVGLFDEFKKWRSSFIEELEKDATL